MQTGGDEMQDANGWLPDGSDGSDQIEDVDPGFDAIPPSFDPDVTDAIEGADSIDEMVDDVVDDMPDQQPVTGPFDGSQTPPEVDPGFDAVPPNFDPIVQDVLGNDDSVNELVDDVLATTPDAGGHVPSIDGVTPGDIAGGTGTDDILGFINKGGSDMTGITHDVLEGRDLSPEQKEICAFLIRKGPSVDAWNEIMGVNHQIDVDLANAHLRELYPNGFHDSLGTLWMPDHETGRWLRVTEDPTYGTNIYHPTPFDPRTGRPPLQTPRSSPGPSSGAIFNDILKPDPFD
jgi:hypothetical protein